MQIYHKPLWSLATQSFGCCGMPIAELLFLVVYFKRFPTYDIKTVTSVSVIGSGPVGLTAAAGLAEKAQNGLVEQDFECGGNWLATADRLSQSQIGFTRISVAGDDIVWAGTLWPL